MKFICERESIIKEISISHEIISERNTLSILSNVLLENTDNTLSIRATDLKVSFVSRIPVETVTPGSTTVLCDKLLGVLRSLPEGEISFDVQEDRMVISPVRQKKINFRLRCIDARDYPEFKSPGKESFTIAQKTFVEMIDQTIFAVSDDETRYYMNGVYMEPSEQGMTMVSTDGRRLSYISRNVERGVPVFQPIIIPTKFLNLIRKLSSKEGEISLGISDSYLFAEFDAHHLSSTLIEGQFPNYRRVIPDEHEFSCVMSTKDINEALKRVSLLIDHHSKKLFMDINADSIVFSSEESEIGNAKEEISCSYTGEPVRMYMNFSYLMSPVRVMESEQVSINFTDPAKAVTVRPVPEIDYFHVIMPMQS